MYKIKISAFRMTSWHGIIFYELARFWGNLRQFAYDNRTIFEIIFLLLYALEQLILILLTFYIKDTIKLALVISIFAVVVLTTFSLHKQLMESRIRILESDLNEMRDHAEQQTIQHNLVLEKYNDLLSKCNELSDLLTQTENQTKGLKRTNSDVNKRGVL